MSSRTDADTDSDADEVEAPHRSGGRRTPRRRTSTGKARLRWVGALTVLAVVTAAASWWALSAPSPGRSTVLDVSHPQPVAPDSMSAHDPTHHSSTTGSAGPGVHPTPARVAQAAPSQVTSQRPRELTLASGTRMRVRVSATARSGQLQIPPNIDQAGWWDGGSKVGDPFGAIVIAAHVDSFTQGLGSFAELLSVKRGDVIRLDTSQLSQSFRVMSATLVPKTSISSTSDAFSATGPPRLVLITCGGAYDPSLGGYQSNLVVVAEPGGRLVSKH